MFKNMNFAHNLKKLRVQHNLMQKEFADIIGVSASTISAYEKGQKVPSINIVKKISETFNVTTDWLIGLTDDLRSTDFLTFKGILKSLTAIIAELDGCLEIAPSELENEISLRFSYDLFADTDDKKKMVVNYLIEFKKVYDLYKAETIDYEMYNMWIEKKVKEYAENYYANVAAKVGDEGLDSLPEDSLPF